MDLHRTGNQLARLFGNHDKTNKKNETYVGLSGTHVELSNGTVEDKADNLGAQGRRQKNVSGKKKIEYSSFLW